MRSCVVLFGLITTSAVAHAQSRADQEPASRPDVQLPLLPAPSDETRDQPAHAYPQPEIVSPPPEPTTRLVLPAPANDTLTSHLLFSLSAAYTNGFGSLDSATPLSSLIAAGYGVNVGVGYGLSPNVEVELNAALARFGAASNCPNCSAQAYDMIGAVRYHLVQGVRFDPWVRVGVGASLFQSEKAQLKRDYAGLQWLNASIGGDWYATRNFGLGPLLSLAMTSYLSHPSDSSASIAFRWLVGLNLAFDAAGK